MKTIINSIRNINNKINYKLTSAYIGLLTSPMLAMAAPTVAPKNLTDLENNIFGIVTIFEKLMYGICIPVGVCMMIAGLMQSRRVFTMGSQGGSQHSHGNAMGLLIVGALCVSAPWIIRFFIKTLIGQDIDLSGFSPK